MTLRLLGVIIHSRLAQPQQLQSYIPPPPSSPPVIKNYNKKKPGKKHASLFDSADFNTFEDDDNQLFDDDDDDAIIRPSIPFSDQELQAGKRILKKPEKTPRKRKILPGRVIFLGRFDSTLQRMRE